MKNINKSNYEYIGSLKQGCATSNVYRRINAPKGKERDSVLAEAFKCFDFDKMIEFFEGN